MVIFHSKLLVVPRPGTGESWEFHNAQGPSSVPRTSRNPLRDGAVVLILAVTGFLRRGNTEDVHWSTPKYGPENVYYSDLMGFNGLL